MRSTLKSQKQNLRQIEGRNPVLEALRAGSPVEKVLFEQAMHYDERLGEIKKRAQEAGIEINQSSRKVMQRLSRTGVHQGVIAWAQWPEEPAIKQILATASREEREPFFIILPQVTYEQNLGALLRTAEAAGVDAVIVSHRVIGLTPVVSRVAMGAAEYVPLIHENIFSVLRQLKDEGVRLVAAVASASKDMYEAKLTGPLALIIGEEHKGLSQTVNRRLDLTVKIPMFGKISSLNLSVAAGILMYEVVRQRRFAP